MFILSDIATIDLWPQFPYSVTEQPVICACGWRGKFIDCELNDEADLTCPKCGASVKMEFPNE